MIGMLAVLGAGLFLAGLALFLTGRWTRSQTGVPAGQVIQSDTSTWRRPDRPLFSARYRLTGRPDYVVDDGQNRIPVEVKSSRAPAQPHASHVMQLAAYCLLVRETWSRRPPYGILQYADRTFAIDFTPQLEQELLDLLSAMRVEIDADEVHRHHNQPGRCARCGFRPICDESLAG